MTTFASGKSYLVKRFVIFSIAAASIVTGHWSLCHAQSNTGALHGTITDSTGAVIPDATIEVSNLSSGQTRQAKSDAKGFYTIPGLAPGHYSARIVSPGFQTVTRPDFQLEVSQDLEVDNALSIGESSAEVQVTSDPPSLATASASLGREIGAEETVALPLNGRQFTQLLLLSPGASPVEGGQQSFYTISFGAGGLSPAVNGQLGGQNVFMIDGILNNHPFIQSYAISPPPDAIQEFRSQSHIADAQFSLSSGSNVNLITKSGTNQIHGDAWEFLRNQKLNAANFFDNYVGNPKPSYNQNQYGFTLGGPVVLPFYDGRKRNTHFFGYYERFTSKQGFTLLTNVPTSAELTGDFSDLLTGTRATDATGAPLSDALGRPIMNGQLYNPYSTRTSNGQFVRDPIPGNKLTTLNSAALTYLNAIYPTANYGVGGNTFPNRSTASFATTTSDQFGVGGDHTFRNNDTLSGKFFYSEPDAVSPTAAKFGAETAANHARIVATSYTHIFNPTLLATVHYGYSWLFFDYTNQPGGLTLLNAINAQDFIPIQNGIPLVPQITIGPRFGSPNSGSAFSQYAISQGPMRTNQFNVDVVKTHGGNNISAGFLFMHLHAYDNGWGAETDFDQYPSSAITSNGTNVASTGDGLASMLLNLPSGYSTTFGNTGADLTTDWYGGYVQDKWQVTPRLNVQFGLRWDFQAPPHYKDNQFAMWNSDCPRGNYTTPEAVKAIEEKCLLVPGGYVATPTAANPDPATFPTPNVRSSIWVPQYNGWQPRFGLAYSLAQRTVFHAGFNVFDDHNAFDKEVQDSRGSFPVGGSVSPSGLNRNVPGVTFDALPSVTSIQQGASLSITRAGNPNAKIPYVMQYNLGFQHQITDSLGIELNYVGSESRHLWGTYGYNQPLPGTYGPNALPGGQPFPFIAGVIQADDNLFTSNYNALQLQVEHRLTKGFSFLASYTYSKCLNEVGGEYDGYPQDTYNFAGDYGGCNSNIKHLGSGSALYQLPFGRGNRYGANVNRGVDALIGGWNVSNVTSIRGGLPFSVNIPFDNANVGHTGRANYVPGCDLHPSGFQQSVMHWYNTACFVVPPAYTFGNSPRNGYFGPRFVDFDFAMFKNFKLTESKRVELRAEGFNVFNHTNLTNPSNSVGSSSFMHITSANPAREIQVAAKFLF